MHMTSLRFDIICFDNTTCQTCPSVYRLHNFHGHLLLIILRFGNTHNVLQVEPRLSLERGI